MTPRERVKIITSSCGTKPMISFHCIRPLTSLLLTVIFPPVSGILPVCAGERESDRSRENG